MSYQRRVKRGIPKNTDCCHNCKSLIRLPHYKHEEETNSYYKEGCFNKCTYLNITSSEETVYEFINSINPNLYPEEDLEEMIDDVRKSHDLHYGHKICGLYLEKVKPTGYFTKSSKNSNINDVDYIDDDDIPFCATRS